MITVYGIFDSLSYDIMYDTYLCTKIFLRGLEPRNEILHSAILIRKGIVD